MRSGNVNFETLWEGSTDSGRKVLCAYDNLFWLEGILVYSELEFPHITWYAQWMFECWNDGDAYTKCCQLLQRCLYLSVFTTGEKAFLYCKCSKAN